MQNWVHVLIQLFVVMVPWVTFPTYGADCYSQTFPRTLGGIRDKTYLNGLALDSLDYIYAAGHTDSEDLIPKNTIFPIAVKIHPTGPYEWAKFYYNSATFAMTEFNDLCLSPSESYLIAASRSTFGAIILDPANGNIIKSMFLQNLGNAYNTNF